MIVEAAGHVYRLEDKDGSVEETQILRFSNREPGTYGPGTTTQDVLRALIDRTHYCNNCLPHPNNERIIYHLRMALVLHEARALERQVEKGEMRAEEIAVGGNGHFALRRTQPQSNATRELAPYRPDWDRECVYPKERHDKEEK